MYVISNVLKISEKDDYENGCEPSTSNMFDIDHKIQSDDLNKVIREFMSFVDCDDKKAVLIDACEEQGRIDIQVMENGEGNKPSASEFERWKLGTLNLYAVTYTAKIQKHVITDISLAELLGDSAKDYEQN